MRNMKMVCKRCGKDEIENEAFNVTSGGFMCRQCFRTTRIRFMFLWLLLIGPLLVVTLVAAALVAVFSF